MKKGINVSMDTINAIANCTGANTLAVTNFLRNYNINGVDLLQGIKTKRVNFMDFVAALFDDQAAANFVAAFDPKAIWAAEPKKTAIFNGIDFQPLLDKIAEHLQIQNTELSVSWTEGERKPKFICPNLIESSGIFAKCFAEIELDFFNFALDEKTNAVWTIINLWAQYREGGSNGFKLCQAWYDVNEYATDGGWFVRFV